MRAGECPICRGAGFYHIKPAAGQHFDPQFMDSLGQALVRCPSCNPASKAKERLQRHLEEICGLRGQETGFRFAGYWIERHGRAPLIAAQKVLEDKGWLTLSGGFGIGKTFLLCATVNEARERGWMAIYTTMADLLDHLRAAYKPGYEADADAVWDNICRCTVLCLDEVEKYQPTPWAESKVMQLMKDRYRTWDNTVTVLATNSFEDVPGWLKSLVMDRRFSIATPGGADVRPTLKREVVHV